MPVSKTKKKLKPKTRKTITYSFEGMGTHVEGYIHCDGNCICTISCDDEKYNDEVAVIVKKAAEFLDNKWKV